MKIKEIQKYKIFLKINSKFLHNWNLLCRWIEYLESILVVAVSWVHRNAVFSVQKCHILVSLLCKIENIIVKSKLALKYAIKTQFLVEINSFIKLRNKFDTSASLFMLLTVYIPDYPTDKGTIVGHRLHWHWG